MVSLQQVQSFVNVLHKTGVGSQEGQESEVSLSESELKDFEAVKALLSTKEVQEQLQEFAPSQQDVLGKEMSDTLSRTDIAASVVSQGGGLASQNQSTATPTTPTSTALTPAISGNLSSSSATGPSKPTSQSGGARGSTESGSPKFHLMLLSGAGVGCLCCCILAGVVGFVMFSRNEQAPEGQDADHWDDAEEDTDDDDAD